jgi:hypothetical protein
MKEISVVIPIYDGMLNKEKFLWDSLEMLSRQTFQDYELIIAKTHSTMGRNFNEGVRRATGRLIKLLCLDDQLTHKDALQDIVESFRDGWLITGSSNNPNPYWTDDIHLGNNKLGSPSALTFLNDNPPLFEEGMDWLIDCDYYKKLYHRYGEPTILCGNHVVIGIHDGQITNLIDDSVKVKETEYLRQKYA